MSSIIVAGLNGIQIPPAVQAFLEDDACLIACSQAHLRLLERIHSTFKRRRWIPIVPLRDCLETIAGVENSQPILFLLSGDPLFFGLGKRIKETFPDRNICFHPAVSYMQSCFALAGINWDDADFASLHGRPLETIDRSLNSRKLFIFTDAANSPDVIARYLRSRLGDDARRYSVHVGECIGSADQRFFSGSLEETAARSFAHPNSMILFDESRDDIDPHPRFGLHEDAIEHSRGLITKREVRAAVIARLQLPAEGVLWDIGAGSGSVGLEAARLFPSLSVYAVEQHEEQVFNIRTNKSIFGCGNLHIIAGQAPEILGDLPAPGRVFVGGSGGRLRDIFNYLAHSVSGPLHVVVTAVLKATAEQAPELLHTLGFDVDVSVVEVSRYRYPAAGVVTFNPIHIICGIRR